MAIKTYKKKRKEFDEHLSRMTRPLSQIQILVEFYRYLTKQFDTAKWTFPFSRYVRVAKDILFWADNDLEKAEGMIFDFWYFYSHRNLNWNLDTAYRNIPSYEGDDPKIPHEHDTIDPDSSENLDWREVATKVKLKWQEEDGDNNETLQEMLAKAKREFLENEE